MNLFCRAGRLATPVLVRMSLENGFSYNNQISERAIAAGERMLMRTVHNLSGLEEELKLEDVLPWDDIEAGSGKKQLWTSFRKAAANLKAGVSSLEAPVHSAVAGSAGKEAAAPQRMATVTRGFWVWLAADDAFRPDCAVARGLLRDLFQKWKEGSSLYLGQPRLIRIERTSGLALLSADFRASSCAVVVARDESPQSARSIIEAVDVNSLDTSAFLYLVNIPGSADRCTARLFEGILKSAGIKFQFIRKGSDGWCLVGETFRRRRGLMAMLEKQNGSMLLICSAKFIDLMGEHRDVMRNGVISGVCGEAPEKCPACGAKRIQPVKIMSGVELPLCIDCFVRLGPRNS